MYKFCPIAWICIKLVNAVSAIVGLSVVLTVLLISLTNKNPFKLVKKSNKAEIIETLLKVNGKIENI